MNWDEVSWGEFFFEIRGDALKWRLLDIWGEVWKLGFGNLASFPLFLYPKKFLSKCYGPVSRSEVFRSSQWIVASFLFCPYFSYFCSISLQAHSNVEYAFLAGCSECRAFPLECSGPHVEHQRHCVKCTRCFWVSTMRKWFCWNSSGNLKHGKWTVNSWTRNEDDKWVCGAMNWGWQWGWRSGV